jgi:hypothetical protein
VCAAVQKGEPLVHFASRYRQLSGQPL